MFALYFTFHISFFSDRILASVKVSVCPDSFSTSKTSNFVQISIILNGMIIFIPSPRKPSELSLFKHLVSFSATLQGCSSIVNSLRFQYLYPSPVYPTSCKVLLNIKISVSFFTLSPVYPVRDTTLFSSSVIK